MVVVVSRGVVSSLRGVEGVFNQSSSRSSSSESEEEEEDDPSFNSCSFLAAVMAAAF